MASDFLPIKYAPLGGMWPDIDPQYRSGGNYDYALNIHHLTKGGGTTPSPEIVLGNDFIYRLGNVSAQNKIFRIYINCAEVFALYGFRAYDGNNILITNVPQWGSVQNNPIGTYAAAVAAITANLTALAQAFTISPLTTVSTTLGYFDFSLINVPFWNYNVSVVPQGGTAAADFTPTITIQEAIDVSLIGQLIHIGRFDLNGDVIIWSTPQTNLPSVLPINNIQPSPNIPLIRATSTNHGLTTGELIQITGALNPALPYGLDVSNGSWIVTVINANEFDLQGSVFVGGYTLGTGYININVNGVGEIGVAQRDDNLGTWTYTRLLRTREWDFRTKKQPKTKCQQSDFFRSIYWTDFYNVPRKFYYEGLYILDGALSFINPLGQYEYGLISDETKLPEATTLFDFDVTGQLQTGGGNLAGNYRYCIQFLSETLAPTLLSPPSQMVNVFKASLVGVPKNVFGDNAGEITGKVNQITIRNIVPNLFKYVQLIAIYYEGTAQSAYIVNRFLLTQQPTQVIEHTGLETNTQTFDLAQIFDSQDDILTAKNIDIVNNRMVLSNTTTSAAIDLTDMAKTIKHSFVRQPLQGILSQVNSTLRTGEYQLPLNLYNYAGYMIGETYRIGLKARTKTGFITDTFWVDDIVINTSAINTANPFGDNRRVAPYLPDYNLTDATGDVVYSIGLVLSNIDWFYPINGIPLRDFVDEIFFERVEMTENFQEVRGSGIMVMADSGSNDIDLPVQVIDSGGTTYNRHIYWGASQVYPPVLTDLCDFHSAAGIRLDNPLGTPIYLNPAYAGGGTASKTGSVYIPDFMFGLTDWSYTGADQIISYGYPRPILFGGLTAAEVNSVPTDSNEFWNALREFSGDVGGANLSTQPVVEKVDIGYGTGATLPSLGVRYNKSTYFITNLADENGFMSQPTSPVAVLNATLFNSGTAITDYGIRNIQIFTPKPGKFGNFANSKYIPTGTSVRVDVSSTNMFGGDVMTEKTWFRHRTNNQYTSTGSQHWTYSGLVGGIAFYSQNRVNTQMINRATIPVNWQYPFILETSWLNEGAVLTYNNPVYNHGYDIRDGVDSNNAFDANLKRSSSQPARKWWSEEKPEDSISDPFTVFLPLNFQDNDLTFGEISEHANVNGNLMTWQQGHFELQYFSSTNLLITNAQEAVLGNAGVMSQRGTALSTYGTSKGFSVIKGKSSGGKDVMAWIDTSQKKVVHFDPSQGTTVISDVHNMRSFFENNLRYADIYDTPADGRGVHGVFDDENSEFIWTVKAWKEVAQWSPFLNYVTGSEVSFGATDFYEIPDIYVATRPSINKAVSNPSYWRKIDKTDNLYYNLYTVAYSEARKSFTTFYSFLPNIYLKRKNLLLSPSPVGNKNRCYEHWRGEYCVWYKDGTKELVVDAEIDGMSINYDPDQNKHYLAVEMNTEIVPKKMRFFTKQNESYLDDADFEKRIDVWVSKIKNDSSVTINNPTGRNDLDTSFIFGTYVSADLVMEARKYQKLFNFIMKAKISGRSWRS